MRMHYLAAASCMALVVFMGFSTSALANHVFDSDCAADPDAFEVTNFTINTPDSNVAYQVSGVTGTGLACGSRIHGNLINPLDPAEGEMTLNDRAVIQNAPGVEVNQAPSADLPRGSYVGEARVDALTWIFFFGGATRVVNVEFTLRVDDRDDPITPPGGTWGTPDCPADSIACYRHKSDITHGWVWVVEDADGSTTMTLGRFYNDITGEPAGITEINAFFLCGYAGNTTENGCGDGSDPSKWLQKNGGLSDQHLTGADSDQGSRLTESILIPRKSIPSTPPVLVGPCSEGTGTYTVTVTNRAGETTDPVSTCVEWTTFRVPSIG